MVSHKSEMLPIEELVKLFHTEDEGQSFFFHLCILFSVDERVRDA